MTEDVQIKLSTELDSKGLAELRKQLNESRNAMNALARETEKGSTLWKGYKESVREINTLLKMSDADLRKYAMSLVDTDRKTQKLDGSVKKWTTSLRIAGAGLRTVVHGAITLNPLLENQSGIVGDLHGVVDKYGTSVLAASALMGDLKVLLPAINAGFLAQAGIMPTLAIGIGSVATAYGLMAKNVSWAIEEYEKGSSFWDIMSHGALNPIEDNPNKYDTTKIRTLNQMVQDALDLQKQQQQELGIYSSEQMNPGTQEGKNDWVKWQLRQDGGNRGTKEKLEKEVKLLSDRFLGYILTDTARKVNALIPDKDRKGIEQPFETVDTLLQDLELDRFLYQPRKIKVEDDSRDTLADIQQGYSLIGQTMQLLNVGADSFAGTLMRVFDFANSALTIGSSIAGFIKTVIGVGGMPAGSGAVNMSYGRGQSPVNLYVSSNVSSKYFTAQIENYNASKNYRRVT